MADDMVQRTWVKALENPPHKSGSQRPWLARVLRNNIFDLHRGEGRRVSREVKYSSKSERDFTDDLVERGEMSILLTEAVLRLNEPFRSTVLMRFHEDMSTREIASQMGVPAATVRTRISRSLDKLRSDLSERWGKEWKDCHSALLAFAGVTGRATLASSWKLAAIVAIIVTAFAVVFQPWKPDTDSPLEVGASIPFEPDSTVRADRFPAVNATDELGRVETTPAFAGQDPDLPIVIRGRCVAKESKLPMADCRVRIIGRSGSRDQMKEAKEWTWEDPDERLTGEDGLFEFHLGLPHERGRYFISIHHEGRIVRGGEWHPIDNPLISKDLGDVLLELGAIVEGRVISSQGRPIENAEVILDGINGQSLFDSLSGNALHSRTNSKGYFRFKSAVPSGSRGATVRRDGFAQVDPLFVTIPNDLSRQNIDFLMKEMPYLEGKVQLPNGTPVAKAYVSVETGPGWGISDYSDAEGSFRLYADREGLHDFQLSVSKDGVNEKTTKEKYNWGDRDITIIVEPALNLDIMVVREDSGESVEEYAVVCEHRPPTWPAAWGYNGTKKFGGIHDGGRLKIEGLAANANTLIVWPWDQRLSPSQVFTIQPTRDSKGPLVVQLKPSIPIEVMIKNKKGEAVAGSTVRIAANEHDGRGYSQSTTDSEGLTTAYLPTFMEGGLIVVEGDHKKEAVELTANLRNSNSIEIQVTEFASVSGTLVKAESHTSDAKLYFRKKENASSVHWAHDSPQVISVDADGAFAGKIEPGEYEVFFVVENLHPGSGGSIWYRWIAVQSPIAELEVVEGQITRVNMDASIFTPSTLSGTLLLNGNAAKGARFMLRSSYTNEEDSWGGVMEDLRTDAQGYFEVKQLMPGYYQLWFEGQDGVADWPWRLKSSKVVKLEPGKDQEVDFAIQVCSMEVKPLRPGTKAVFVNTTWILSEGGRPIRSDGDGWLSLFPAPQGEFYLRCYEDRVQYHLGPLKIEDGQTEMELEMEATIKKHR
ncbi:MAG: sigma-70 family RNA polymerase sigma factor [Planctomycetes bacterium]|nr:sigma-70 family RNA polymerase sigma factor [Planctomycetota bacterium]